VKDMSYTWVFSLIILFLISGVFAEAEETGPRRPIPIGVRIEIDHWDDKSEFRELFIKSLQLEMQDAGIELSRTRDPDILINGSYKIQGNRISFTLSAEVLEDGALLFRSSAVEELSFKLEDVLMGHSRRLIAAIVDYHDAHPDKFNPPAEEPGAAAAASPGNELQDDPFGRSEKPAVQEPAAAGLSAVPDENRGVPDTESPAVYETWQISADLGLCIPGGEGGRYLKTGYASGFYAGYNYNSGRAIGMSLEAIFFMAEGYAAEANGYVLSLGPGIRLKAKSSDRVVPGFRADVFGTLFYITPDEDEAVLRVIPSAEAGMTLDFLLGRMLLNAAMNISVFFDGRAFLVGFTPKIGVNF